MLPPWSVGHWPGAIVCRGSEAVLDGETDRTGAGAATIPPPSTGTSSTQPLHQKKKRLRKGHLTDVLTGAHLKLVRTMERDLLFRSALEVLWTRTTSHLETEMEGMLAAAGFILGLSFVPSG